MAYVALRPMELAGAVRRVGQPIPEAAGWTNLRAWVNQGHIAQVADHEVDKFVAALGQLGAVDANRYAPSSKPHHLAAAARKLQMDVAAGLGTLPPSGSGAASSAPDAGDSDTDEVVDDAPETTPAPKGKPQSRKRSRNA